MTLKSDPGNFFEDFVVGDELVHATPRTVTEADAAIYTGLNGSRYALYSADTFAQDIGLEGAPIDPLLAFHVVFGKTVPDISLNAVANLGYAAVAVTGHDIFVMAIAVFVDNFVGAM